MAAHEFAIHWRNNAVTAYGQALRTHATSVCRQYYQSRMEESQVSEQDGQDGMGDSQEKAHLQLGF